MMARESGDCPSFILGTAQLGMDYGIANTQGRPDAAKAVRIVEAAWAQGIRHFDTAQSYGDSEAVLGQALRDAGLLGEAKVGSKLSVALDPTDRDGLAAAIEGSFERLGVDSLWCMLLHRATWLDHWDEGLGELLLSHRAAGRIKHLGASLLGPDEAPRCLAHPDVEILQAPSNAWDRRLVERGVFEEARSRGQLCCVRSVYLQGLLTLLPEQVATRLPAARPAAECWHALASRAGIAPVAMALRYALGLDVPLVVGADSPEQIAETVALAEAGPLPAALVEEIAQELDPVLNETIIEPWRWEK